MTPQEFVDGATVTPLGGDWGSPLWRLEREDVPASVEVHGETEEEARQAALESLPSILSVAGLAS